MINFYVSQNYKKHNAMKKYLTFIFLLSFTITIYSQSNDKILDKALKAQKNMHNTKAIELFNQYLEKDTTCLNAYFGRAKAYYWVWRLRGKEDLTLYKKCFSDIKSSLLIDSTNCDLNFWIAENIALPKGENIALPFYNQTINHCQKNEKHYRRRGHCLMNLRIFDLAVKDFEMSTKLAENTEMTEIDLKVIKESNLTDAALCFAKLENYEQALISSKQAIKLNPNSNINHIYYATILSCKGELKRSEKIYKSQLKKNASFAIVYLLLGNIYNEMNELDKAEEYYKKAMQMGIVVNSETKLIKNQIDLFLNKRA